MAEVLIKLERAINESDLHAWNRLHPVCVKPDGWQWGSSEGLPKFCVIRITNMTVEEVQPYLLPDIMESAIEPGRFISNAIRKWKFDIDDVAVPTAVKNAIKNTGMVSVTKAQIVNFIKRTING